MVETAGEVTQENNRIEDAFLKPMKLNTPQLQDIVDSSSSFKKILYHTQRHPPYQLLYGIQLFHLFFPEKIERKKKFWTRSVVTISGIQL